MRDKTCIVPFIFSHENLINAYTDVPTTVEILDLSINKISSIGNDDFKVHCNWREGANDAS